MTIVRRTYVGASFFVFGLVVGVLWSPLGGSSGLPGHTGSEAAFQSRDEELTATIKEIGGPGAVEFSKQFEEMTIRIKKSPIDAWASPDGRFVIRLFGSNETIASDLRYPEQGGEVKDVVRHYSFSSGDHTFSIDFARSIKDGKLTEVHYSLVEANGHELVYVDTDADGRWERFVDYTQKPPKSYERDGLCWRERVKDAPGPKKGGQ